LKIISTRMHLPIFQKWLCACFFIFAQWFTRMLKASKRSSGNLPEKRPEKRPEKLLKNCLNSFYQALLWILEVSYLKLLDFSSAG
jgi:hypothetical protein